MGRQAEARQARRPAISVRVAPGPEEGEAAIIFFLHVNEWI